MVERESVEFRVALARYGSDPAAVVQLARDHGMSVDDIVREVVKNITRDERRAVAEKLAPHLKISVLQFMRIADART